MTTRPSRTGNPVWLPYVGLAAMIVGAVYQSGQLKAEVDRHTAAISKLEARADAKDTQLSTINERGARIEAKLDLVLPDRERRGEER